MERYRRTTARLSSGPSSRTAYVMWSLPRSSPTSPAARASRTQPTSPNGETTHVRSPSWTGTTGVERVAPLRRPRTVRSRMKRGPRPLRSARAEHPVGPALHATRSVGRMRLLGGRHRGPPSGGPMKLYCIPAIVGFPSGSVTTVNETRVSVGIGVPPASPTACWWATMTAVSPWRWIASSSRSRSVVSEAVLEAPDPRRLVEHEADGTDAHEVVGEERIQGARITLTFGGGPRGEHVVEVGGHRVSSLSVRMALAAFAASRDSRSRKVASSASEKPARRRSSNSTTVVEKRRERRVPLVGQRDQVGPAVPRITGCGSPARRPPCG